MSLENLRNPPPGQPPRWSKGDRVRWNDRASDYVSAGRTPGNIFSRAVDWICRSDDVVAANKRTARKFIGQLEDRYGETVSQWATKQLSGQLTKGRPLSWRRVGIILTKADATATQARGYNTRVLNRLSGEMINEAVRDLFNLSDDFAVHPHDRDKMQWLEQAVKRAVEAEPSFAKRPLDDPAFRDAYTDTVTGAVDSFYQDTSYEELGPLDNLADFVPPGRFPRLQPLLAISSDKGGVPLPVQEHLLTLVAIAPQIQSRIDRYSSDENVMSRDDIAALTAFLARLGQLQTDAAEMKPKSQNEGDLLGALARDADALDEKITKMLGIDDLDKKGRSEVIDAFQEVQDLQEKVHNPQTFLTEFFIESGRMEKRLQGAEEAFRDARSEVDEAGERTLDTLAGFAKGIREPLETLLGKLKPLEPDLRVLDDAKRLIGRFDANAESPDVDEVERTMRNLHRISRGNRVERGDQEAKGWVRDEAASLRAMLAHVSGQELEGGGAPSPFEAQRRTSDSAHRPPESMESEAVGNGSDVDESRASEDEPADSSGRISARNPASVQAATDKLLRAAREMKHEQLMNGSHPGWRQLRFDRFSPDDQIELLDSLHQLDEIQTTMGQRPQRDSSLHLYTDQDGVSDELQSLIRTFDAAAEKGEGLSGRARIGLMHLSDIAHQSLERFNELREASWREMGEPQVAIAKANDLIERMETGKSFKEQEVEDAGKLLKFISNDKSMTLDGGPIAPEIREGASWALVKLDLTRSLRH